jgi:ferredoxin
MKYARLLAGLAVLCLLAGSAYALAKLAPAEVDQNKCTGCGKCIERCPEGAISFDEKGQAQVDQDKCTGCGKCTKACPFEAISISGSS